MTPDQTRRRLYRAIARLLPRDFREAAGADLEQVALACAMRERSRGGMCGEAWAWLRIAADAVSTSARLQWPGRATRDSYWTGGDGTERRLQHGSEALVDNFRKDFLYALRALRRQPGFALITIVTLALGIGANTAIFSVVNGVLLQPLPYPRAEQLEFISSQFPTMGFDQFWVDLGEYVDFRAHNATFASIGAYGTGTVTLGGDVPSRPLAASVTPDLMPTLGVAPLKGRWFTDDDSRPGAEPVVILSSEIWKRQFGGDPGIVNRTIMIGTKYTRVVGIMPPGYDVHDEKIELWQPVTIDPAQIQNSRGGHFLHIIGRRKPDATPAAARADVDRMLHQWATYAPAGAHVPDPVQHRIRVDPLKDDIVGGVRMALIVLQCAVGFVLLIACVNLANLLMARADSRQREFAVRTALGAGRSRLLQQFIVEGLMLTMTAAAIGSLLAWMAVHAVVAFGPEAIPRSANVVVDARVLLFTLVLAIATGLLFGAVPLLHLDRGMAISLRDGTRTTGGARRAVRGALVVSEVALAVVLVVGAGLLVRSFVNLIHVDTGFNRSQLVTFDVVAPVVTGLPLEQRVAQRVHVVEFFNTIREKLGSVPGARGAAGMIGLPPNRPVDANDTMFEWIPKIPKGQKSSYPPQNVDFYQAVTLGYTETMGIPVVKGRGFTQADAGGAPVVLVNEALAKRFFSDFNRDPIGERIKPGYQTFADEPWFTIIGVVKDVKQRGVDAAVGTELYGLQDQMPMWGGFAYSEMNFVVRTTSGLDAAATPIHQIIRGLDPRAPVVKLRTMDDVFGESVSRPRFITMLLGVFAALALGLAAIGTYGVLAYLVAQRGREIGIRMALGADRSSVLSLILRQGLTYSVLGLAIGLLGALGVGRVLRALLFQVHGYDPTTLLVVTGLMITVAGVACIVPAWRATRVDPLIVLRDS